MDEDHLGAAVRYVAMNPVRAGLAERAVDWSWSSSATLLGRGSIPDIAALLESAEDEERTMRLSKAESIGRPIGSAQWIRSLEKRSGRPFSPGKGGRKAIEKSALSP